MRDKDIRVVRAIEKAKKEWAEAIKTLNALEHLMAFGRALEKRKRALVDFIDHGHCNSNADQDSVCGGVCDICRDDD